MTTLTLDHIVIAVRDLDAATGNYQRIFGRKPSWRGRHPTYGTANTLFRLTNTYIELLSLSGAAGGGPDPRPLTPDPGPAGGWAHALQQHLDARGEGLYALALGTDDIDATVADARARGLDVLDPAGGDGIDLDTGATRRWRNARIRPESTRGVPAFFIQHLSPPDALPLAQPLAGETSAVGAVDHTVIASTDLDATLRLWQDTLGLDLRATVDWPPNAEPGKIERRLYLLRIGPPGAATSSILELAGQPDAAKPGEGDTLWGVSYRPPDVAAAVARMRDEGLAVSDVRPGNAPNTFVADLKPGFSNDVRTLFIQKEVS